MPPQRNNHQAPNNLVQLDTVTTGTDAPAPSLPPQPKSRTQRKTKPKKEKRPIKMTGFAMQGPSGDWYNYKGRCPAPVTNDARRTTAGSPSQPPSKAHDSLGESPNNPSDHQLHGDDVNRTNEPGSLSGEPHSRSVGFDAPGNPYYTLPPHLQDGQHIHHPVPPQTPTSHFALNSNVHLQSAPPHLNPAPVQQPPQPIHPRGMEYEIQHAPDYVPQNSRGGSSVSSAFGMMIPPRLQTGHSNPDNYATTWGGNVTARHHAAAVLPNSYPHLPPRDYRLQHPSLYDANAIHPGIDAISSAQQFSGPRYVQPSQYSNYYHANALSHPTNYISMGQQREVQGDLHQPPIQYTSAVRRGIDDVPPMQQFVGHQYARPSQYNPNTLSHHISMGQQRGVQGDLHQLPVRYISTGNTSTALAAVPPPVTLPLMKRKHSESFSDLGETQTYDEAKKMKLGLGLNDDSDFESGDVFGRFQPLDPVQWSTGDESYLGELLGDDSEGYVSGPSTSESSFGLDTPEPDSEPDDVVPRQEKQKQKEAELEFDVDGWFAPVDFGLDDIDGWAGIL
ncbi:hypothetical protein BDZ89DRAFT_1166088 [Hymenopellis radicata]|nr:hypothetical protein BDZ89DRAFT_1166088 [Hymenopellis radicata]